LPTGPKTPRLWERFGMARGDPPIKFEHLLPYYNGAYFASVAIKGRLAAAGQIEAAREVTAYQEMVSEFREAIKATAKLRQARNL
jgi:hypothetical protein